MKIAMPPHLKKQIPPQPNAAVPFLSREPPAELPTLDPPIHPVETDPHEHATQLRDIVAALREMADYLELRAGTLEGK